MAQKKLADEIAKTNQEYTKLKSRVPDDVSPRETPGHQGPGRRGLHRPDLDNWTTEELREAARTLNLSVEGMNRERLVEAIVRAQQPRKPR